MQGMHGVPGRNGRPARLPSGDLHRLGVLGNGELQIVSPDGGSSRTLVWRPNSNEPIESAKHSASNYRYASPAPRQGDPPPGLFEDGHEMPTERATEASGATPGKLTGAMQFVQKLLELWHLETHEAVGLLGFEASDSDHVAAVLRGNEQFRGRDVRDRISNLFWIRSTVRALFRNLEAENDWLRESHPMLGGRQPLELLLSGSIEDLLLTKEYVDLAAGR